MEKRHEVTNVVLSRILRKETLRKIRTSKNYCQKAEAVEFWGHIMKRDCWENFTLTDLFKNKRRRGK